MVSFDIQNSLSAWLWNTLWEGPGRSTNGVFIQTVKEEIPDGNGGYIVDPNGATRLIVYIGGTTGDWVGPNQSILSNLPAAAGFIKWDQVAAIQEAINKVSGPVEEIMIVGYS